MSHQLKRGPRGALLSLLAAEERDGEGAAIDWSHSFRGVLVPKRMIEFAGYRSTPDSTIAIYKLTPRGRHVARQLAANIKRAL